METMYTMKQACELTGMNYEALKFYCNSELVPAVGRDGRNHRIFDDQAIAWIIGLNCLKRCGLSIKEMQHYTKLCQEGDSTIAQRKEILVQKRPSSNNDLPKSKETSTISTKSSSTTTSCLQEKPHPPESLPNSDAGRTAPHANNID